MEYIYAVMLLHGAGKPIEEKGIKRILEAAGVTPEETRVKALVASLEGVDIEKAIKEAALPVAAAPAEKAEAKTEAKKEEKKEEKAEQAAAGLGALFGIVF